jgi:3-dehydrosphinganine reductase
LTQAAHAIISGGSSGIGLALARLLAAEGWNLSLIARRPELLAKARAELLNAGSEGDTEVTIWPADVSDPDATVAAVRGAITSLGAPDLVVTSAGMVVPGCFESLPLDAFRRSLEVNVLGTVYVVRAALPAMRARGGGRIVMIASGAALVGLYGYTAYSPAKFAVRGLAEALRCELQPEGIGVSVVYPPDTDTPQLREEMALRPEATRRLAAAGSVKSAEQVAASIWRGVTKGRFVIAPGWQMASLVLLHSVIAPVMRRYWADPVVARALRDMATADR